MLEKIGINPVSLIAQLVNFGILFFVLSKFIYKPLLRLFDERAKKISLSLKAAESTLKEKEKLEEYRKKELKKIRQEAEKIILEAKNEAKNLKETLVKNARQEAKREAEKEYQRLRQRLQEKEQEFKAKTSKLVIELTKKTLQSFLDVETQKKIFNSQLKKLKQLKIN